jgi:PIN domain nuclease of toxin-antitoxin system
VRVLLDTQAFLWFVLNDARLSRLAENVIADPAHHVLVSPASYWEVAVKVSVGRYALSSAFEDFWRQGIAGNGFSVLPVELRHAAALSTLPFHHRDPFDRMLVAQAIVEGVPLVSCDAPLDAYAIQRIW